jgi:hypothetical protein
VAGVAGDEDPRDPGAGLGFRHVVELVAEALADLVDRPPADVLHVERVRVQDPVCHRGQLLRRDAPVVEHVAVVDLVQFDVEPDQVAALPRDDQ